MDEVRALAEEEEVAAEMDEPSHHELEEDQVEMEETYSYMLTSYLELEQYQLYEEHDEMAHQVHEADELRRQVAAAVAADEMDDSFQLCIEHDLLLPQSQVELDEHDEHDHEIHEQTETHEQHDK